MIGLGSDNHNILCDIQDRLISCISPQVPFRKGNPVDPRSKQNIVRVALPIEIYTVLSLKQLYKGYTPEKLQSELVSQSVEPVSELVIKVNNDQTQVY